MADQDAPGGILAVAGAAQRRHTAATLELWNARLELLNRAGSLQDIIAHLASPLSEAGNNCECNMGCNVPCGSNCGGFGLRNILVDRYGR